MMKCSEAHKEAVRKWQSKNQDRMKIYAQQYRVENQEKRRLYNLEWRRKNRKQALKRRKKYYQENIEKMRTEAREWQRNHPEQKNRWQKNNPEAARIKSRQWWKSPSGLRYKEESAWRISAAKAAHKALKIMAMPPWVDREAIARVYLECRKRTLQTGIPHHVDHIMPLHGKGFVGLHVHWNLQILTATENISKGNRIK